MILVLRAAVMLLFYFILHRVLCLQHEVVVVLIVWWWQLKSSKVMLTLFRIKRGRPIIRRPSFPFTCSCIIPNGLLPCVL